MMATVVNSMKRICVLLLLLLLCSSECGVFGLGNSAESNSLLAGKGGIGKDSEGHFVSRERKSVGGEKDGSNNDKDDHRDYSTDRGDGRSLGVFNDNETATEPSGVVEAQVLPNSSLAVPVSASFAASITPSVTDGGTTRLVTQLTNGSSEVSGPLSTPVTFWPIQPSSNAKVSMPQSAKAGPEATSSAAVSIPITIPTATLVASTAVVQSTRISTPTHRAPTSDVTTAAGDVQDTPDKKKKTLFGFVTVEILIALLAGAACAVILVAFLVYRIKKKNEGSYELCEMVNYNDKTYTGRDSEKEVFV